MAERPKAAVFLDRDGVLIEDRGIVVGFDEVKILDGAAAAMKRLHDAGYELVTITNQPVIARGLASEEQIAEVHRLLAERLEGEGGAPVSAFYVCPHHPSANLADYRVECDCRKPRPGLLIRAAEELALDLAGSFMVGDRMSDVAAGARAGCRTVLVRTGAHRDAPIESPDPPDPDLRPDHACDDLAAAVDWILAAS